MGKETYLIEGFTQSIDSKEEWMFIYWLLEAVGAGLVEPNWAFHPKTFVLSEPEYVMQTIRKQLKTKLKITEKKKEIIKGTVYTPDFKIFLTQKYFDMFPHTFLRPVQGEVWIDTKGGFNGPHNNSAITFPVKQKWLFQKEDIYVQKLVPKKFFKQTWVPERATLTYKTLKPCAAFVKGYKTLVEKIGEFDALC